MTTIVFSNLYGPTKRDKMPSPDPFAQWTYMYHDNEWYWVKNTMIKNRRGQHTRSKQWVLVPQDNHIPKEHKLTVLLLT